VFVLSVHLLLVRLSIGSICILHKNRRLDGGAFWGCGLAGCWWSSKNNVVDGVYVACN